MSESGASRRVGASAVGTPRGDRTVTSASPVPNEVIVFSMSKNSVIGNVRAVLRSASASSGVNTRSACWTRFPSWARTDDGTSVGTWVTK